MDVWHDVVDAARAVVGLCGVLSCAVARRTKEIGIRLAPGAPRARVVRLVVGEVAILVAAGLAGGAGAGLLVGRLLRRLLFEVRPSDSWGLAPAAGVAAAHGGAGGPPDGGPRRAHRSDAGAALRAAADTRALS